MGGGRVESDGVMIAHKKKVLIGRKLVAHLLVFRGCDADKNNSACKTRKTIDYV